MHGLRLHRIKVNRTDGYSLTLYSLDTVPLNNTHTKRIIIPLRHRGSSPIKIPAAVSFYTRAVMHVIENIPATSHLWHVITQNVMNMNEETSSD
jgi:hypothetical protein